MANKEAVKIAAELKRQFAGRLKEIERELEEEAAREEAYAALQRELPFEDEDEDV